MAVTRLFALLCIAILTTLAHADNWARFRGPNGTGASSSTLPVSWTPDANVAWKVKLPGAGVSSPIVVGDRVFVTCYSGYGLDRENPGDIKNLMRHLVCFDATTGDVRWRKDIAAAQPEDPYSGIGVTAHGYASHTPTSDGKHVYVYFGKSGAFAFDMEGEQVWQASLGNESDPWKWGSAASPILYENLLIVTAAAEGQAIVGLDTKSGKEVWRQEAAGLDGMWGTPMLVKIDDGRTDLVMSVPKEMWGLDPATGKLRWYCEASGAEQTHSSPIASGDTVFAFTGRGGGSVAIKAGGSGDVSASAVVWNGRDTARFGSPVRHEAHLYLVANGVLSVIDGSTGKKLKQVRLQGGSSGGGSRLGSLDYASPIVAGDKLYYVNGKGQTFVFSLGAEPKQLSVNLVTGDEESFGGTPAVSADKMYLRSNKHLYCVTHTGATVQPNASSNLIAKSDPGQDGREGGREGGGGRAGGGRGGPRGGFDPVAIFQRSDANKDNRLSKDEVSGTPMESRFADFDKDKDDAVTLEEFREACETRSVVEAVVGAEADADRGAEANEKITVRNGLNAPNRWSQRGNAAVRVSDR